MNDFKVTNLSKFYQREPNWLKIKKIKALKQKLYNYQVQFA
jgi:uncharacterized membrane protein YqhA